MCVLQGVLVFPLAEGSYTADSCSVQLVSPGGRQLGKQLLAFYMFHDVLHAVAYEPVVAEGRDPAATLATIAAPVYPGGFVQSDTGTNRQPNTKAKLPLLLLPLLIRS